MKCQNQSCGEELAVNAKFCMACGARVPNTASDNEDFSNFVYLLSADHLRRVKALNINPPFGAIGITLTDGVIDQIHYPSMTNLSGGNVFTDLLSSALEVSYALTGNKKKHVQTYVMMDLRDLPIATYSHKVTQTGQQDSSLFFKFWVDIDNKQHMMTFLQRCLKGAEIMPLTGLNSIASAALGQVLNGKDLTSLLHSESGLSEILHQLQHSYGISSSYEYRRGAAVERREFAFSQESQPHHCPKCSAISTELSRFCESCGTPLNFSDFANAKRYLITQDAVQLTVRVSALFIVNNGTNLISDSDFKQGIFSFLVSELSKHTSVALKTPEGLSSLSSMISRMVTDKWPGQVVDCAVVDLGSSDDDWFFGIDTLIASEIKKVEANKQALQIDEKNLDLKEAAFAIALRRVRQNDTEQLALRNASLEAKKQVVDIDVQEHALDSETGLRHEEIDDATTRARIDRQLEMENHEAKARKTRADHDINNMRVDDQRDAAQLEIERERLAREAKVRRESMSISHSEEVLQFGHEQAMEEAALTHDLRLDSAAKAAELEKQRLAHEAELEARRGNLSVSSEEEQEKIRVAGLRAAQDINLAGTAQAQAQDIELSGLERRLDIEEIVKDRQYGREQTKLEKMAELEARMAAQDHAQEQTMAQLNQQAEKTKYEVLRGLSAAEILAMQAVELVKVAGPGQSAVDIVKGVAESQAAIAGANIKEQMYQEMLRMHQETNEKLTAAHKSSAEAAYSASASAMENMRDVARAAAAGSDSGYKEAAKIAQSVNEKSMDAMAKVATAAATKKPAEGKIAEEEKELGCVNPNCKHMFKGKRGMFCPKCGSDQSD